MASAYVANYTFTEINLNDITQFQHHNTIAPEAWGLEPVGHIGNYTAYLPAEDDLMLVDFDHKEINFAPTGYRFAFALNDHIVMIEQGGYSNLRHTNFTLLDSDFVEVVANEVLVEEYNIGEYPFSISSVDAVNNRYITYQTSEDPLVYPPKGLSLTINSDGSYVREPLIYDGDSNLPDILPFSFTDSEGNFVMIGQDYADDTYVVVVSKDNEITTVAAPDIFTWGNYALPTTKGLVMQVYDFSSTKLRLINDVNDDVLLK